jgi:hypothetical protein
VAEVDRRAGKAGVPSPRERVPFIDRNEFFDARGYVSASDARLYIKGSGYCLEFSIAPSGGEPRAGAAPAAKALRWALGENLCDEGCEEGWEETRAWMAALTYDFLKQAVGRIGEAVLRVEEGGTNCDGG